MRALIDEAREAGRDAGRRGGGGCRGSSAGSGSHAQWDRRLDGHLARRLMSIPAVKAWKSQRSRCGRPAWIGGSRPGLLRFCRPSFFSATPIVLGGLGSRNHEPERT